MCGEWCQLICKVIGTEDDEVVVISEWCWWCRCGVVHGYFNVLSGGYCIGRWLVVYGHDLDFEDDLSFIVDDSGADVVFIVCSDGLWLNFRCCCVWFCANDDRIGHDFEWF